MGHSYWFVLVTSETPRCWLKDRCLGLNPDPLNWNIRQDAQECSSHDFPGDFDWQQQFPILAVPGWLGRDVSLGITGAGECEERMLHIDRRCFPFLGSLIFSRAIAKPIFHSSMVQIAQNLALSSFVEISSLVIILPAQPQANKLLLIVGLGKGLKIEQGSSPWKQNLTKRGKPR